MSTFISTPTMRALSACVRANVPVLIWGEPGQAKSAKIESYGKAWGMHVETVVGSVRESTDYLGLPVEVDGGVVYSPPEWARRLNNAKKGLAFFDELTTSSPSTQKAMLRVLQERVVGEYAFKDSVAIIAAANPPETAADGWDLPAPVANRMIHLDWHFDADEWLAGVGDGFVNTVAYSMKDMLGVTTDVHRARAYALVTGFIRQRPEFLAPAPPTDPEKAGGAWASPRSWTNLIDVLSQIDPTDEDTMVLLVRGSVGEDIQKEFVAWAINQDLPNPDEVMANPNSVNWADRPDMLFAIVSAVSHVAVHRGDLETWNKAVRVMEVAAENDRPDVALPSMKALVGKMPKGAELTPTVRKHFTSIFERAGVLRSAA